MKLQFPDLEGATRVLEIPDNEAPPDVVRIMDGFWVCDVYTKSHCKYRRVQVRVVNPAHLSYT